MHEQNNALFDQAIYHDEETELYYELLLPRDGDTVELYVGRSLLSGRDWFSSHGEPIMLDRSVKTDTSRIFPVSEGESWETIRSHLPSYLMRMHL